MRLLRLASAPASGLRPSSDMALQQQSCPSISESETQRLVQLQPVDILQCKFLLKAAESIANACSILL